MRPSRYSRTRQKACQRCSEQKLKCDRTNPCCSRCSFRNLACTYPQATLPDSPDEDDMPNEAQIPPMARGQIHNALTPPDATDRPNTLAPSALVHGAENVRLPALHAAVSRQPLQTQLVCPIDADAISMRWMNQYIPIPGQMTKAYSPSTTAFTRRILRSYARVIVNGHGIPPFVHPAQLAATGSFSSLFDLESPAITACLRLVRIADDELPGSNVGVMETFIHEMDTIYERYDSGAYEESDISQLAAFQAYLLYMLVLVFIIDPGGIRSRPFLQNSVMVIQRLASASARGGLICATEQFRSQQGQQGMQGLQGLQQPHLRPSWVSWLVSEAKRRTLYTMYLLDSTLSAQDGMPTFLGTELSGLPAPSSGALWGAWTEASWAEAYAQHAADWPGEEDGLRINELWPMPADTDEAGMIRRRKRIDHWIESIDAFGTMIYAVTSHTHGV